MQFKVNEKVLCFHGPLLYVAKILKAENRTAEEGARIEAAATQEGYVLTTSQAGPFYFVHYQGWKQTWDEWVPETRLMKHIEENISFSKLLQESWKGKNKELNNANLQSSSDASSKQPPAGWQPGASGGTDDSGPSGAAGASGSGSAVNGKAGEGSGAGSASAGAAGSNRAVGSGKGGAAGGAAARGSKRTREIVELEDEYVKRPEVKIAIPEPLKVILVDDWERVTKNSQLVQLPRRPCVQQVLDDYKAYYIKHRKSAKRTNATTLAEVLDGLRLYFDKSLTHNLLYRFERLQYTDFRKAWMQGQERDAFNVTGAEFAAGIKSRTEEEVAKEREKGKGKGVGAPVAVLTGTSIASAGTVAVNGASTNSTTGAAGTGAASTKSGLGAGPAGAGSTGKSKSTNASKVGVTGSLGEVNGAAMRQRDDLMEPSRIYGAEHLLRLFVNLPSLVAHTTLDSESIQILKDHLTEFLTYMTRERDRIFVKEYQPASVDYHRLSGV
ncbi:hypothetical protein V8E36_002879 [Tilletia maclaganii]